jgi:hypothetical protein
MCVFVTTGIRIASSLLPAVSAKESAFADYKTHINTSSTYIL